MRYPAAEKLEIIRLVEQSHLPVRRTLAKISIPPTTFYRWYDRCAYHAVLPSGGYPVRYVAPHVQLMRCSGAAAIFQFAATATRHRRKTALHPFLPSAFGAPGGSSSCREVGPGS